MIDATIFLLEVVRQSFKQARETRSTIHARVQSALVASLCIFSYPLSKPISSRAVTRKSWMLVNEALGDEQTATALMQAVATAPAQIIQGHGLWVLGNLPLQGILDNGTPFPRLVTVDSTPISFKQST